MPTRHAWNDNTYEGKLIRKGISKLAKKLKEAEETEELIKILNALSTAANTKMALSKYEHQDKKIKELEQRLKSKELVRYVDIEGDLPALT